MVVEGDVAWRRIDDRCAMNVRRIRRLALTKEAQHFAPRPMRKPGLCDGLNVGLFNPT